jgi:hypothetical protein
MKVTGEKILEIKKQVEAGKFVSPDKSPFFEGNLTLLKSGLEWKYTHSEKGDQEAVLNDPITLSRWVKMRGSNVILRDYQKEMLKAIYEDRRIVFNKSRQIGCNIIMAIAMLTKALLGKTGLAVFNKADSAKGFMDSVKDIYQNLPHHLQKGIISWSNKSIVFENGGRIISNASSKSPAFGYTIDFLYIDEMAHIPDNIIEPFWRAIYPVVTSQKDSIIVLASTPNGKNLFHKLFTENTGFRKISIPYSIVPGRNSIWFKPFDLDKVKGLMQGFTDMGITWKIESSNSNESYNFWFQLDITESQKAQFNWKKIAGYYLNDIGTWSSWKEQAILDIGGIMNFEQEYNNRFL